MTYCAVNLICKHSLLHYLFDLKIFKKSIIDTIYLSTLQGQITFKPIYKTLERQVLSFYPCQDLEGTNRHDCSCSVSPAQGPVLALRLSLPCPESRSLGHSNQSLSKLCSSARTWLYSLCCLQRLS